ncbi:MAG: hypothetical protein O6851_04330, partial [Gemmatimonadetes bacterium]|nr:hypothetical protein [Gemmatimonadota bacterium]
MSQAPVPALSEPAGPKRDLGSVDLDMLERLGARLAVGGGPRESIAVEMPFTGEILGHVPRATA